MKSAIQAFRSVPTFLCHFNSCGIHNKKTISTHALNRVRHPLAVFFFSVCEFKLTHSIEYDEVYHSNIKPDFHFNSCTQQSATGEAEDVKWQTRISTYALNRVWFVYLE